MKSSVSTTTQENAADPIKQKIEQLVQSLTSALNDGLHKPKMEILNFDGNTLEYIRVGNLNFSALAL